MSAYSYASSCVIPKQWVPLKLLAKRPVNHDTFLFDFALPADAGAAATLRLPVCGCLMLCARGREHASKGGGDAVRPYTPVSAPDTIGRFTLLVKVYQEWGDPQFAHSYRPAGAVSNFIAGLRPGIDSAEFCHLPQNVKLQLPFPPETDAVGANGAVGMADAAQHAGVRTVTMVAVGAGVAPMLQALELLLARGSADHTRVVLLLGNRSVRDILMRERLEVWQRQHPARFKLVFVVGSRWTSGVRIGLARPEPPEGFKSLAHPRLIELAQELQAQQERCTSDAARADVEAQHFAEHRGPLECATDGSSDR